MKFRQAKKIVKKNLYGHKYTLKSLKSAVRVYRKHKGFWEFFHYMIKTTNQIRSNYENSKTL